MKHVVVSDGYFILSWNEILPTKQFKAFVCKFSPLRRKLGTCRSVFVTPALMTWLWEVWTTCGYEVALKKHALTLRFSLRPKDCHLSSVNGRPQNVLVTQRYAPVCDYLNVMDDVFAPDVCSNQYFKFNVTQSSNVPNNIMLLSDD